MPVSFLGREDAHIVNIDHHHDNTCFGTANLVVDGASCTAEIIWGLLPDLGVELTSELAEALYIGLVTDTGKFQYENTTPNSHRMAAELLEHGLDVHSIFRRLYENVPFAKLQLLARVLNRVERHDDGRLTLSYILRKDYEETGADENFSEGIVDHIRALEGTVVAALVREQLKEGRDGVMKVSLRASADEVDVSVIARKEGGGGHRQAAGFSTTRNLADVTEFLRREIEAQR
jgi:phosphoesterase RecJ-like protein